MPELNPCPICSSLSVGLCPGEDEITHEIYNQAFCTSCGASGPRVFADEISAIVAWNSLPRALTWTTEPPKVAGWYWRKETAKDRTHVFHFTGNWEDYGEYWESDRVCPLPLKLNGNLWAGPIPTPHEPEGS